MKIKNRRRALLIVAAVALIVSAFVGVSGNPASAHNQDNNSYFGCAVLRPSPAANYSVDHSWWTELYPDLAVGRCMWHNIYTGTQVCAQMYWHDPGQPGQYFQGVGYDYDAPCWFSPHN